LFAVFCTLAPLPYLLEIYPPSNLSRPLVKAATIFTQNNISHHRIKKTYGRSSVMQLWGQSIKKTAAYG
jgi:hypothetical protein